MLSAGGELLAIAASLGRNTPALRHPTCANLPVGELPVFTVTEESREFIPSISTSYLKQFTRRRSARN